MEKAIANRPFLQVFNSAISPPKPPPVWFMRQAGRYLPGYRRLRAETEDFLSLCLTPHLAAEVTLEPIQRFGVDAAIIFADILLIPHALGQKVRFLAQKGPQLEVFENLAELEGGSWQWERIMERLSPVSESLKAVRSRLDERTALIGFCGAPWTLATYMLGGGSASRAAAGRAARQRRTAELTALLEVLVEASVRYLLAQAQAGADALQIFDTWAGELEAPDFQRYAAAPTAQIIRQVRTAGCTLPILCFVKDLPAPSAYIQTVQPDGLSLGTDTPLTDLAASLPPELVLQGNLAPELLLGEEATCLAAADAILETMRSRRHIFNLGHGILPQTDPERVARLIQHIRMEAE